MKIRIIISRIKDTAIIIASIVLSKTLVKNPNSLTKSKIVIAIIRVRIITTNGIYFVNDLINCDASELYCVSEIGESAVAVSSIILLSMSLF